MATAGSIEEAAKAIPEKKESLRKAFDDLKSLPSSHSFFTLQWEDLDDHFSSLQSSVDLGLRRLRALEAPADPSTAAPPPQPASPSAAPPPELLAICSATDSLGLRAYLWKNRAVMLNYRKQVEAAIRSAPDPARLVLFAIFGNYETISPTETDRNMLRRSYVMLLEILLTIRPEITPDLAAKARHLALKWKARVPHKDVRLMDAGAFLKLVTAYRISAGFKVEELLDVVVTLARSKLAVAIFKELDLEEEHVITLIEKLIGTGKHAYAVKFIYAYKLVERFPPVPLLKEGIKEAQRSADKLLKQGSLKAVNEAIERETTALQATIKIIQEYSLESEYSIEPLQQQIEKLAKLGKAEKRKAMSRDAARKRNAAAASLTNVEDNIIAKQRSHLLPIADPLPPVGAYPAAAPSSAYPAAPLSQPYMADRVPYLGSAGTYAVGFYDCSVSGLPEPSVIPGSRLSPPRSYLYPPERQIPYNRERVLEYDRPVSWPAPAFDRPGYGGKYGFL